jgi:S1-C subfamily serine protease
VDSAPRGVRRPLGDRSRKTLWSARAQPADFADIAEAAPVVSVTNTSVAKERRSAGGRAAAFFYWTWPAGRQRSATEPAARAGFGSGFIISNDGYPHQ